MERVKLMREFKALATELGLEGADISQFINNQLELVGKKECEEREREREEREKEREREREEKEKEREYENADREHTYQQLQISLEIEKEKTRQRELQNESPQTVGHASSDASPSPPSEVQPKNLVLSIPIEAYDPKIQTFDIWMQTLEKFFLAYDATPEQRCLKLVSLLKNDAYQIYCTLSPSAQENYEEIKAALYRHYRVSAMAYRTRFREARRRQNESYQQMSDRLRFLLKQWIKLSNLEESFENLSQLILMEALENGMPSDVKTFVNQNAASTLEDVIKYADRYLSAKAAEEHDNNKKKTLTTEKNHKAHPHPTLAPTPKPSNGGGTNKKQEKYCSFCKMRNSHYTQDCRKKNLQEQSKKFSCASNCSKNIKDEEDEDRPKPVSTITVNGRPCKVLFDTGLDFSCVVAPHLVKPEQLTDEYVDIQCASLDFPSIKLRIANIEIQDCPYVIGTIPAAILESPVYEVILGARYVYLATPPSPILACPAQTRQQASDEQREGAILNPGPAEMRQSQRDDPTLGLFYKRLNKAHNPPKKGDITEKNGLLYRVAEPDRLQLIIPKKYRQQVLEMGHDIPFGGHMGVGATTNRITTHYHWPGINEDIKRYVRSCYACQKKSNRKYTVPVKLGEMPVVGTPFERIAADILGPLELTKKRNRFILTIVDTCTMWAEAIPLPRIDAKTVADAFIGVFTRVGIPKQILTDNGSQFCGKLMQDVYGILQAQHITTSVYHPQSNGQVERFNGTIISILKKLVEDRPQTWDTYVAPALYAYRDVPHASSGFSPSTLLYGRALAGPLEVLKRSWTDEQLDESEQNAS